MADAGKTTDVVHNTEGNTTGFRFEPPTDETSNPVADRIAELREKLNKGEDPFAARASADAGEGGDGAEGDGSEGEGADAGAGTDDGAADADAAAAAGDGDAAAGAADGEAGEGDAAAEGEAGEGDGAGEEEGVTVTVRDRQGNDIEIVVPDQETADLLRANHNDGLRRDEFNKQMQSVHDAQEELALIDEEMQVDPVGFLAGRVHANLRVDTVKHLLATMSAEEFAQVSEALGEWGEDDEARELAGHRMDKERKKKVDDSKDKVKREREGRENARHLVAAVDNLASDGMTPRELQRFQTLAYDEIQEYANINKLDTLDPAKVPVILEKAGILKMFGLKAEAAVPERRERATPPAASSKKKDAAEASRDTEAKAQAGAAQIKKTVATRKAVTAVAPVGTGAAPARVTPPKGQTGPERIDWLRKNPQALPR